MGRLDGRVAIVTGAGRGIGAAVARLMAAEGASVVVNDLGANVDGTGADKGPADEVVEEIRKAGGNAIANGDSVADHDAAENLVRTALNEFGRLDVLVNAAAVLIRTPPLAEVDERDWDLVMDVNLKGMFFCCKYAIPAMLENGGGSIVNISSGAGIRGFGMSLPYAVSKAGVIHLTTTTASQYTSQGIRANVIAPGSVDTPQFRGSTASSESVREREEQHPMGRIGKPEEIANVILFLASDEASYISGSLFIVDGGGAAVGR